MIRAMPGTTWFLRGYGVAYGSSQKAGSGTAGPDNVDLPLTRILGSHLPAPHQENPDTNCSNDNGQHKAGRCFKRYQCLVRRSLARTNAGLGADFLCRVSGIVRPVRSCSCR